MSDTIRIAVFFGSLLALLAIERWRPRVGRVAGVSLRDHYALNAALLLGNMLFLRLLFPLGLVGLALVVQRLPLLPIGLPDALAMLGLPAAAALALESLIVIVVFDIVLWAQHMLFHRLDWLWRLHRVHHSDERLDVSTGFRFNPAEVFLSYLIKIGLVLALAPSALALVAWLVVFNLWTLFTHADLALPRGVERWLGALFITPDVHRVHHLNDIRRQNSNYGSIFCVWDRLFGTRITASPEDLRRTPVGLDPKFAPSEQWARGG